MYSPNETLIFSKRHKLDSIYYGTNFMLNREWRYNCEESGERVKRHEQISLCKKAAETKTCNFAIKNLRTNTEFRLSFAALR
jgi:hypothetical protein